MSDPTPLEIFAEIDRRVKSNPDKAKLINAVYQFNITGEQGGTWTVDCIAPEAKEGPAGSPGCTFTISDSDFVDLVLGKLHGQLAFMSGRLKVGGNLALAMKLQQVLGN